MLFSLHRDLFPENPDLPDRYLELFCIKSDTAIQYVKKWISLAAASQLVKGKEEERDFLLRQINVAEYD
jgi:hypothetical protein